MQTILAVDDIPENIAVLAGILRGTHKILVATNGPDALSLVQQYPVDLILLDVMMPGMSGYEVCQRLKSNMVTAHIPVIFVTSLGEHSDEQRGLELGAADFLHKPCHASIVRLRVKMHLERYNQSLALERRVSERTIELESSRKEIVRRLGRAAEYRDNETGQHVIRMSKVSHLIALAADVPAVQAELLLNAAPMHDVGKIGIPDGILLKPGKLEGQEWEVMKTHTLIGAEIIGDHDSELLKMARVVALTHHEKWNGSGYPHGMTGEDIPLEGRIVSIADVFDALTSERPYKRAWSVAETLEYMRGQSGISFDPDLLALFMDRIPEVLEISSHHAEPSGSVLGELGS